MMTYEELLKFGNDLSRYINHLHLVGRADYARRYLSGVKADLNDAITEAGRKERGGQ